VSCPNDRLELYLDGELPPGERPAIEAHLEACPDCRRELEEIRRLETVLRGAPTGAQPRWDVYVERVAARTKSGKTRWFVAAAAAILVGFTVWNVWEVTRPRSTPPEVRHDLEKDIRAALIAYGLATTDAARQVQLARIRAFGDAGLPVLVRALEDGSPAVQISSARVLATFRDEKVRELLIEYAKRQRPVGEGGEDWTLDSTDPRLVAVAMREAERSGSAERILNVLGRGPLDPEVREAVSKWAFSLLASKSPKLRELGLAIVREADVEFPWLAVIALLEDPINGRSALEALRERTCRDFGADPKAWRRYVEEM